MNIWKVLLLVCPMNKLLQVTTYNLMQLWAMVCIVKQPILGTGHIRLRVLHLCYAVMMLLLDKTEVDVKLQGRYWVLQPFIDA